jgi:hypothetical protein
MLKRWLSRRRRTLKRSAGECLSWSLCVYLTRWKVTVLGFRYRKPSVDSGQTPSALARGSMGSRAETVKEALASADSIQPSADGNAIDTREDSERGNQCRNPLCQRALRNSYASYCEDRPICQQHRALRLQCQANAENSAAQGTGDSFLVVETRRSRDDECEEKQAAESSAPYVIPRRKCPTRAPPAAVPRVSLADSTVEGGTSTSRETSSVGAPGTRKRKRPQLGPRLPFDAVLAHFDRTMPVPTATAASQTPVRRLNRRAQQTRLRRTAREPSVQPRRSLATSRSGDGGGRYGQLAGRSRTDSSTGVRCPPCSPTSVPAPFTSSARDNPRDSAPVVLPNVPSPLFPAPCPTRGVSFTEDRSNAGSQQHESDRCENVPPRIFQQQQRFTPVESRSSQVNHRTEYERTVAGDNVPHANAVQMPGLPTGYPPGHLAHRNIAERRGCGASLAANFVREDTGRSHRRSNRDDQRLPVRIPRYNDEGNAIGYDETSSVDNACARSWGFRRWDHRDEGRSAAPFASAFHEGFQPSDGGHNNEVVERNVRQPLPLVEHPQDRRHDVSSRVAARSMPRPTAAPARNRNGDDALQGEPSDADPDSEPTFSFCESLVQHLLSMFIQSLPSQLQPVANVTRWYVECTKKIERSCKPYVQVEMQSTRVVVRVQHRAWLTLKGPSTVELLQRAIKSMRDEALSWRALKSEVEQCLELYRTRSGDAVDLSSVFLRAWNTLKSRAGAVLLPRQSDYFYGTRLHHWKFVAGNVEIGSGSHEGKREAFRLAARSAARFLLEVDDGQNGSRWRPPRVEQPSDSGEECEFLFERSVGDEPLIVGPSQTPATSGSRASQELPAAVQFGHDETGTGLVDTGRAQARG